MNTPKEALNKRQDAVLALIEERKSLSTRHLLQILGRSMGPVVRITLIRDIKKLLALGLIERTGAGRSVAYRVSGVSRVPEKYEKNNPRLNDFIQARPHLVWYVNRLDQLSVASIVENTLNYGTWQDVRELIRLLGIREVASIFTYQTRQGRNNYRKEIANYFQLYFNHYASH